MCRAYARLPTCEFLWGVGMIVFAYAYYFLSLLPNTFNAVLYLLLLLLLIIILRIFSCFVL